MNDMIVFLVIMISEKWHHYVKQGKFIVIWVGLV